MKPFLRSALGVAPSIVRATYASWREHRTIRLGAGLAYYGLFSLTSVIAVSIGLLRIFGRSSVVEADLTARVEELFGATAAESVSEMFSRLDGSSGTSIGLIGVGSLLVTGSLFFVALEDAIHQIWDVPVRSGLRSTMRRRLVSLVVLLGAGTTLVVSFAVQAVAGVLERLVPGSAPGFQAVSAVLTAVLGWSVLAVALTLLFRYLPSAEVRWAPTIVAAVTTSVLLVVGTALIGWYLRTIAASSLGGVASTPIVVLLWIYYEAQILLVGVHLSRVLGRR
jgi:membrane protein